MTNVRELPDLPVRKGFLLLHNTGGVSQVWGYTADQMHAYALSALQLAHGQNETMLIHNRNPHCCGCWVIHWNDGIPVARCNECAAEAKFADYLAHGQEAVAWQSRYEPRLPDGSHADWFYCSRERYEEILRNPGLPYSARALCVMSATVGEVGK